MAKSVSAMTWKNGFDSGLTMNVSIFLLPCMQKPYCMGKSQAKGYCFRTASGSFATHTADNGGNIRKRQKKTKAPAKQTPKYMNSESFAYGKKRKKKRKIRWLHSPKTFPVRIESIETEIRVQAVQPFCRLYSGR